MFDKNEQVSVHSGSESYETIQWEEEEEERKKKKRVGQLLSRDVTGRRWVEECGLWTLYSRPTFTPGVNVVIQRWRCAEWRITSRTGDLDTTCLSVCLSVICLSLVTYLYFYYFLRNLRIEEKGAIFSLVSRIWKKSVNRMRLGSVWKNWFRHILH